MRWPIRNQIFLPFAVILATAVAVIAVTSAVLAARRSERQTVRQLQQVVRTLGSSSFPYTGSVLEKMRGLSGAQFIVLDRDGHAIASTFPESVPLENVARSLPDSGKVASLNDRRTTVIDGESYLTAVLHSQRPGRTEKLCILYPERSWRDAQWEAAFPPLAVGGATLFLMLMASLSLSARFGRRIATVQDQVARIARGRFHCVPTTSPDDEIRDLVSSVNRMAEQLQQMQQTVRESERMRLLGQLAGGFAHQLRNAVTGARMAVQLHRRRCTTEENDQSLEVALQQLSLTEEQVKGLLSLGRREQRTPVARDLRQLLAEVEKLVHPACRHAKVTLESCVSFSGPIAVDDGEGVRLALLNLVLNAVEAVESGGTVTMKADSNATTIVIDVVDTGPGPPETLQATLFDPFVSSKPEGVGLGLSLALQVARDQGGTLDWHREQERTVFRMTIPLRSKRHHSAESVDWMAVATAEVSETPL